MKTHTPGTLTFPQYRSASEAMHRAFSVERQALWDAGKRSDADYEPVYARIRAATDALAASADLTCRCAECAI